MTGVYKPQRKGQDRLTALAAREIGWTYADLPLKYAGTELDKMNFPNADRRVMDIQLKELILHGFIQKQSFQSKIPKVEYELLSLGESFLPLIIEIEKWGEDHRGELENALVNDRKFDDVISPKVAGASEA